MQQAPAAATVRSRPPNPAGPGQPLPSAAAGQRPAADAQIPVGRYQCWINTHIIDVLDALDRAIAED